MDNIITRIIKSKNNHSSNMALITPRITLSYDDMHKVIKLYFTKIKEMCFFSLNNQFIAIYISSPLEAIIAQIAVMFHGAICIPLDTKTPLIYYSLDEIGNIACIITDEETLKDINFPILYLPIIENIMKEKEAKNDIYIQEDINESTYCMITSGTTGTPKAVLLKQEAILNQIDAKIALLKMNEETITCLAMNLSFVASIWQVLGTLFVGGTLILLEENIMRNPYTVFKEANTNKASILCITPSFLRAFLMINKGSRRIPLKTLKMIVLTGELLYSDIAKQFYDEYNIPLINAYGQTECTDDIFHYRIPNNFDFANNQIIPIGTSIPKINYMILGDDMKPVKVGKIGELYITGICLARGYIRNKELITPFCRIKTLSDLCSYGTNDLVSQDDDGLLICHGRKDNQIKMNGYRIYPEIIEKNCLGFQGIRDALVLKNELVAGSYLSLQYITQTGEEINTKELKKYLAKKIPFYMIPSAYDKVDYFRYSSNGKKIRKIYTKEGINDGYS